jgi:hypothetical protein
MGANKAKFKAKLSGTRARPGRVVSFELDGEKIEVELREPNEAVKYQIAQKAGAGPDSKTADAATIALEVLTHCAFEPGTVDKFFAPEDVPTLLEMGPEINPLINAALRLMNPENDLGNGSRAIPSSA